MVFFKHTHNPPSNSSILFIYLSIYLFLFDQSGWCWSGIPPGELSFGGFFPSSNRCNFALAPCAGSNKPRRPSSRAQAVTPVWWELHSHLHLPASSFLLGLIPACTGLPLHSQSSLPHPQSWFFFVIIIISLSCGCWRCVFVGRCHSEAVSQWCVPPVRWCDAWVHDVMMN